MAECTEFASLWKTEGFLTGFFALVSRSGGLHAAVDLDVADTVE
jgi:hypothetical protein